MRMLDQADGNFFPKPGSLDEWIWDEMN